MSATNPEESTNPEPALTPTEIDSRNRLEATARDGLGTYLQLGDALTEIRDRHLYRDSHPSFEAYVRERWGVIIPDGDPLSQTAFRVDAVEMSAAEQEPPNGLRNRPCEALAKACEETLSALDGDDRLGIEIRLAVLRRGEPAADGQSFDPMDAAETTGDELVPTLRWLLTQAAGTIGEVAHELETRAADIGDDARAQLRADLLVLNGELAIVNALLIELHDWDSELRRLLADDVPPFDDPDDDS